MSKAEYVVVTSTNDTKDVEDGIIKPKAIVNGLNVAVLGQGLMGTALTARLRSCTGVTVHAASRNNEEGTVNFPTALSKSSIIILAIPAQVHNSVISKHHELFQNKIVIDLSNEVEKSKSPFTHLLSLLPHSSVIKAFNTISAYDLAINGYAQSACLPICGDNVNDKRIVLELMTMMGLKGVDYGNSDKAQSMEALPLKLFSMETRVASLVTLLTLLFTYVYAYELYVNHKGRSPYEGWLIILNKSICWSGLQLLSLAFLPATLVRFAQHLTGRSYIKLGKFMNLFMGCRKSLGLYAALLIFIHAIMAIMVFSGGYVNKFFNTSDEHMNYRGELCMTLGITSFVLMVPMVLASMPGIGAQLSWKEYHFIFHHIGWTALFLGWAHLIAADYPRMLEVNSWTDNIPSVGFMSSLLPTLVLGLKLLTIVTYSLSRCVRIYQKV